MTKPDPELFPPDPADPARGTMHQVAPGLWCTSLPDHETPGHVVCRLRGTPTPGHYELEPEDYPGWVRMQEKIGERLGLRGMSDTTMRRLLACGFIDSCRPAPGMILINLESLMEHLRRTANDVAREKSWWTKERRDLWRSVIYSHCNLEDGY